MNFYVFRKMESAGEKNEMKDIGKGRGQGEVVQPATLTRYFHQRVIHTNSSWNIKKPAHKYADFLMLKLLFCKIYLQLIQKLLQSSSYILSLLLFILNAFFFQIRFQYFHQNHRHKIMHQSGKLFSFHFCHDFRHHFQCWS